MPPPPSTAVAPPPTDTAPSSRTPPRALIGAFVVGVLAVVALTLVLAGAGGSEPPPATGAAALVPSNALLYVHLSTDSTRPAVRRALALLRRLPDHGAALAAIPRRIVDLVGGAAGTNVTALTPWLGKEAAFALLNTTGGSAGSLTILDVRNRTRALQFVRSHGGQPATAISGAPVYVYRTGAELAFVGRYLVVGADADVRTAIQVWHGQAPSLAADHTYQRATAGAPDGRVLDAYAPAAGVLRLLDSRSGFLGALGALVSPPSLLGAELTVTPQSPGLAVRIHTALDHATAVADAKHLAPFHPTLAGILPQGSTLMLDARNLSLLAPIVLGATSKIGFYSQIPDLLHRLGGALTATGGNPRTFLDLFTGETAVALASGSGKPALVLVTRTSNEQGAREALATVESGLAQVFAPTAGASASGLAPQLTDVAVAGVDAHQVALGPGLQVDFAVFKGLIVLATSTRGIADVAARVGSLDHAPAYRAVLGAQPNQVTSLGFADFSQLLSLGEQTQLAQSAGYRSLLPELQQIRAVGIDSTRGEDDTTAELFLQIP
jgi:hypothetical protein